MIQRRTTPDIFRLMRTAVVIALLFISSVVDGGASTSDLYARAGLNRVKGELEAPEFVLKTIDGQDLDRRVLKGKVILVNFWATWCGPCKEEMPALERLRRKFSGKEFEVVAITADIQPKAIVMFSKTLELTFPILLDETKEVSDMFGVRGLPTSVLIDSNGKLLARAIGPRVWDGPEMIALIQSLMKP